MNLLFAEITVNWCKLYSAQELVSKADWTWPPRWTEASFTTGYSALRWFSHNGTSCSSCYTVSTSLISHAANVSSSISLPAIPSERTTLVLYFLSSNWSSAVVRCCVQLVMFGKTLSTFYPSFFGHPAACVHNAQITLFNFEVLPYQIIFTGNTWRLFSLVITEN